jgi:hypothetical protein
MLIVLFLCRHMSLSLKRAWEVMNGANESDRPKTFEEFVKRLVPDYDKYKNVVYMHISHNFYRGGSLSQHWLVPKREYERLKIKYRIGDHAFRFGEVNGKHSDVSLTWEECVERTEEDPIAITEIVSSLKAAREPVMEDVHKDFLSEDAESSSSSSEENEEEENSHSSDV